MTKCYKIKRKFTKTIHSETFLKLEGIHVDIKVPFHIWLDVKTNKHFASCEYIKDKKSYKIRNIYSNNGILLKRNNK